MSMFTLHPALARDTFPLAELPLCRVTLMNNAFFPWLILSPRRHGMREIIDLTEQDQTALMREIAWVSRHLRDIFSPDKLNVAALGNQVPQLHVHVIARYADDVAWPNPVWGRGATPYTDDVLAMMKERLQPLLAAAKSGRGISS